MVAVACVSAATATAFVTASLAVAVVAAAVAAVAVVAAAVVATVVAAVVAVVAAAVIVTGTAWPRVACRCWRCSHHHIVINSFESCCELVMFQTSNIFVF